MAILKFLKRPKLELHALGSDETWYERCYWLTLLVREQKEELTALRQQNKELLNQVNAGEALSTDQEEFLHTRNELNELHKAKSKLDKRVSRTFQVNQGLMDEVQDLRNGIDRAA